jgi:hypothetical protein
MEAPMKNIENPRSVLRQYKNVVHGSILLTILIDFIHAGAGMADVLFLVLGVLIELE